MEVDLKNYLSELAFELSKTSAESNRKRLTVLKGKESCQPGCSSCCKRLVYITIGQAILIHERIRKDGDWESVKKKCEELKPLLKNVSSVSWYRMNIECPLLVDNLCSVYSIRPTACSTHFVMSDPELCDPWSPKAGSYDLRDFDDLRKQTESKIDSMFNANGVLGVRLPIVTALLFAEYVKTVRTGTPEQLWSILSEEFR